MFSVKTTATATGCIFTHTLGLGGSGRLRLVRPSRWPHVGGETLLAGDLNHVIHFIHCGKTITKIESKAKKKLFTGYSLQENSPRANHPPSTANVPH